MEKRKVGKVFIGFRDNFPVEGNKKNLYVDIGSNQIYRWNNTDYVLLSEITLDKIQKSINEIIDNIN